MPKCRRCQATHVNKNVLEAGEQSLSLNHLCVNLHAFLQYSRRGVPSPLLSVNLKVMEAEEERLWQHLRAAAYKEADVARETYREHFEARIPPSIFWCIITEQCNVM
jgi:hypothetical protein